MGLLGRIAILAGQFQQPVTEFLQLPGKEADASFKRMFATLGKHPLVGVSALGGLVAVFAYAKALEELHDLGIPSAGLISTGDIADFASRFAVPFILLVVAFVFLVLTWVQSLKANHRRFRPFVRDVGPAFVGLLVVCMAYNKWWSIHAAGLTLKDAGENNVTRSIALLLLAVAAGYLLWGIVKTRASTTLPPEKRIRAIAPLVIGFVSAVAGLYLVYARFAMDWPSLLFIAAITSAVVPALKLLEVGQTSGVRDDDRWQLRLLTDLRHLSTAAGLLLVFSVLGAALVITKSVSVLSVQKRAPDQEEPRRMRVLETKQPQGAMFIHAPFLRMSNVWLVSRTGGAPPKQPPAPGAATEKTPVGGSPWVFVASGEVACVRDVGKDDNLETNTIKTLCAIAPEKPAAPPAQSRAPHPHSIAAYAERNLDCVIDRTRDTYRVLVVGFDHDLPKNRGSGRPFKSLWSMPASDLGLPGLQSMRTLPLGNWNGEPEALMASLRQDKSSTLWLVGFASNRGAAAHNLNLSERRALALRDELIHAYWPKAEPKDTPDHPSPLLSRIKGRGLGEDTFSGLFGTQYTTNDQLAIAFLCAPKP